MSFLTKKAVILAIIFALFGYGAIVAFAGPYTPGQYLDPVAQSGGDCTGPNDADCYVTTGGGSSLWSANGADIYFDTGLVGIGMDAPTHALTIQTPPPGGATATLGPTTVMGGAGLDDATFSGTYTGTETCQFAATVIDTAPGNGFANDRFVTALQGSNCTFVDSSVLIEIDPGVPYLIADGISITFAAGTGHTPNGSGGIVWGATASYSATVIDPFILLDDNSDTLFEVTSTGDVTIAGDGMSINSVAYTWPNSNPGVSGYVLSNNGNGQLSWVADQTGGGGGGGSLIGSTSGVSSAPTPGVTTETFLGNGAGGGGAALTNNTFIGINAGSSATGAASSTFLGHSAGSGATQAFYSNFIGQSAGLNATGARYSNYIGFNAGTGATNADYSNFIGLGTAQSAVNASRSTFLGHSAGSNATNAANSTFLGFQAGWQDTVDNTAVFDDNITFADTSVLIGHRTNTGGFSNSIAIGAYAENTAANEFMIGSATRPISETVIVLDGIGGECSFSSGGASCSSDERLKNNLHPLESSLTTLRAIEPIRYTWNSDGTDAIGFSAQNVREYFPELVKEGSQGFLIMNYANMTPILTKAIQELDEKVIALELGIEPSSESVFERIAAWLGNASNGIETIVAKVFKAERIETNELCVGAVCVTEAEFLEMVTRDNSDERSSDENIQEQEIVDEGVMLEEPVEEVVDDQIETLEEPESQEEIADSPTPESIVDETELLEEVVD